MTFQVLTVLLTICLIVVESDLNNTLIRKIRDITVFRPSLDRIVKADYADYGQFPYQVSIYYYRSSGKAYFCGGTLIGFEWVITAAHCLNESSTWDVKLGSLSKSKYDIYPGELYITAYTVYYPGNFGYNQFEHDIGLIQLPYPVQETSRISPIRLPRFSDLYDSFEGRSVIASGWGKLTDDKKEKLSPHLMYTQLYTISNYLCRQHFLDIVYDSIVCAQGYNFQNVCQGDSGGPLVNIEEDGEYTLVGIIIFVDSLGCSTGRPSGSIRVSHYLQWIQQYTGLYIRD